MNDLLAMGIQALQEAKKNKIKEEIQFVGKSSILANWVQMEMGKTSKTTNIDF